MWACLWFSVLLNLKHIYLYITPAVGIYLLRSALKPPNQYVKWFKNLLKMASIVLLVFILSFGPFIMMNQLKTVLQRLFPFKRGLCHAYWAPNIWALYNILDKVLVFAGNITHLKITA